ncbi:hypothetical protein [Amycolatopsis sp. NPDC051371]|uniref:hypothetical protein n=1 Tax=Amycolatopsis sp. NPDC051371 TaxID=3155800 RepID=UPI0034444690
MTGSPATQEIFADDDGGFEGRALDPARSGGQRNPPGGRPVNTVATPQGTSLGPTALLGRGAVVRPPRRRSTPSWDSDEFDAYDAFELDDAA